MKNKRIYTFGDGHAEGSADMKNLLGGKGANLAEMNLIGVPVPPGFTITTEVCTEYNLLGQEAIIASIKSEVEDGIKHIENLTGNKFGDPNSPLLVSVRSGARVSMPGMMDTVLNLGLNDGSVETLAAKSGNPRFAWDSYRRFIQMYGDVVLGMKPKTKLTSTHSKRSSRQLRRLKALNLTMSLQLMTLNHLFHNSSLQLKRLQEKISLHLHGTSFGVLSAQYLTAG
jgi:Phosphoenolpyruvate synthase/pyruvate phosphate dikinase